MTDQGSGYTPGDDELRAMLREVRTIAPGPADHPPLQHDRLDDPDAMFGQQPPQFPAQRAERSRLDFDQAPGGIDGVDAEPPPASRS